MAPLILFALGFVLFLLAGFNVPAPPPPRWSLGWFGAAAVTLALLLEHWPK